MKLRFLKEIREKIAHSKTEEERFLNQLSSENSKSYPKPSLKPAFMAMLFLLITPLMFMRFTPDSSNEDLLLFYTPLVIMCLIFCMNQFLLVPKFFFFKRYKQYFIWNIVFILFCFFCREIAYFIVERESGQGVLYFFSHYCFSFSKNQNYLSIVVGFIVFLISVIIICSIVISFNLAMRKNLREYIQRDRDKARLQYELDFLKNQLSPHFLFNTLNNISSLISFAPKQAELSMMKLSKLLRMMLYQASDKYISVQEEAEILLQYTELEKLRFDENYDLKFDIELENPDLKIAPLIAMPLVENALKHSINPRGGSFTHISIVQKENSFIIQTENSNNPRKSSKEASGLGLNVLRKRLDLIYTGEYEYKTEISGDVFKTFLKIELN